MEDQRQLEVVNFYNIDTQDFEGAWGGVMGGTYFVAAKTAKKFPRFLAEHFCKQLAIKILTKEGKDFGNDSIALKEKMALIITDEVPQTVPEITKVEEQKEPEFADIKEDIPEATPKEEVKEEPKEQAKYVCDVCQKTFKNALGLAGHKRSHKS